MVISKFKSWHYNSRAAELEAKALGESGMAVISIRTVNKNGNWEVDYFEIIE